MLSTGEITGTAAILIISFVFRNMPVGVRAGMATLSQIDKSLDEASHTLGARSATTIRRVVLPPALLKVWPAMVSQIIIVMLGSAVCGQISTPELSYAANLISSNTFRAFEAFILATAVYLLLSIATRRLLMWVGARFLIGR